MRVSLTIPTLLLASAVGACGCQPRPSAPTPTPPPVPLRTITLHDVQGLHGGRALWASEGGKAVVQVVGDGPPEHPGLWEKRYDLNLTPAQWAEAERLVGAHRFLTLKIEIRSALPDEAHPTIAVVTKEGAVAKVTKRERDRQPDFDALYGYLRGLPYAADRGKPVFEGAHDWEWRPEGFDRPW